MSKVYYKRELTKAEECKGCVFYETLHVKYGVGKCNQVPVAEIRSKPYLSCKYHCRPETPLSWRLKMYEQLVDGGYIKNIEVYNESKTKENV
jgi:hypothetical protein